MRAACAIGIITIAMTASSAAHAHSIRQKLGGYRDSEGLSRERVGLDATVNQGTGPAGMTDGTVKLGVTRDQYRLADMSDRKYEPEVYGSSVRVNHAVSLSASQTWEKVTETRLLTSYSSDTKVKSRTWSAGVSQWYRHETLRMSVDVSRTLVERPVFEILDFDSEPVAEPAEHPSVGATLAFRHLATPTTIADYSASRIDQAGRPATFAGSLGVKRYLPPLGGAIHVQASRALNRGVIGTDSTYGEVDAWAYEANYFQTLWRGALSRLGYRYYKEDEITRAYRDQKVFGSDTVTMALSQELPKGLVDGLSTPLSIEIAGARYLTNAGVSAASGELGVTARF